MGYVLIGLYSDMPPRREPRLVRVDDIPEVGRGPPPPLGDPATRVLDGMARLLEQVRDGDLAKFAIYMMWDDASLWWEGAAQAVDVATLTWARFRELFLGKYFPADVRGRLTREFMGLRQGDLSMVEFIRKFDKGCHFVPMIAEDAVQKLSHFLYGMRPTLRQNVMLMRPASYDEATAYDFLAEQALQDINYEMHKKRQQTQSSSQPQKKQFYGQQRPQGHGRRPQHQQRPPQAPRVPKPYGGQPCLRCSWFHFVECRWGTFRCFVCGHEGHKAADCPKSKGPTTDKAYVMHAEEAEAALDSTLITGVAMHALLDSGATHSFISESFMKRLGIKPVVMDLGYRVSIPSGDQMFTSRIVKGLELRLQQKAVQADLIVLPLPEFDIILGMDWISSNGAVINFCQRSISVRPPNGKPFVFEAARHQQFPHVISCMCARKLIERGCQAYLASVVSRSVPVSQRLEDVDVVNKFSSVFPDDVSGIPPNREDGIEVDPSKVESVRYWPVSKSVTEIRSFLGLAGYYRKFIEGFSSIAVSMTALTKKNAKFSWGPECQESFDRLKQALITAPVLAMPLGQGEFVVYTDASKLGLGAVLMQ
ncbi:uncharacterized protein LOC142520284 [Primulina tabacum]|uniref:uncharacterized protein LOC142520284 n=1 Tax=Primulina tabacum TaxID=48773 RepID=UPI003F5A9FFB